MTSILFSAILAALMPLFVLPSDPLLNRSADVVPVESIQSVEIQSIIQKMMEVARMNQIDTGDGVMVGLAAPQIGISKRIILVDMSVTEKRKNTGKLEAFINPEIIWYSDDIVFGVEGCYSVDDHLDGKVPRSEKIKVRAYDSTGELFEKEFSGFQARIFQHEIDHLNGIRFPDRVGDKGALHWIPDGKYQEYRDNWETWPLICPFDIWLKMKAGEPYTYP